MGGFPGINRISTTGLAPGHSQLRLNLLAVRYLATILHQLKNLPPSALSPALRNQINALEAETQRLQTLQTITPREATSFNTHLGTLKQQLRREVDQIERQLNNPALSAELRQTLTDRQNTLRAALTELETVNIIDNTAERPPVERTQARPTTQPAATRPVSANAQRAIDSLARSQVVASDNALVLNNQEFQIAIPINRAVELANQHQGAPDILARELTAAARITAGESHGRLSPEAEITARLVLAAVVDKLVKDLTGQHTGPGAVSRETVERIVSDINRELQRIVASVETRVEVETTIGREAAAERIAEERAALRSQEHRATERAAENSNSLTCEITREEVNVSARLMGTDLAATARQVIGLRPGATLPQLAESLAVQLGSRLSQQAARTLVRDIFAGQRPIPGQQPIFTSTTVHEFIRSFETRVAIHDQPLAVGMILEHAPNAALPDLLAAQAKATGGAREALGGVIKSLARTEAGGRYVLTALATNDKALNLSPLRDELMVEAARGYRIRANQNRNAGADAAISTSLAAKTPEARLDRIAVMAARDNASKLADKNLTTAQAEGFLKFVVGMERVAQRMGEKNIAVLEKQAATASQSSNPRTKATTQGKSKPPAALDKTVAARRALTEMLDAQKTFDWQIPPEVYERVGAYYSSMAGLSNAQKSALLQPQANLNRAPEMSRPDVLNQVLKIMLDKTAQAQAVTPLNRVMPNAAANIVAATVPALTRVFGLLFTRLMADLGRTEDLRKVLAKKGYLNILVQAVQNGNFEAVIGLIDVIALQINDRGQRENIDEATISQIVEQALDDIQQTNAIAAQLQQAT